MYWLIWIILHFFWIYFSALIMSCFSYYRYFSFPRPYDSSWTGTGTSTWTREFSPKLGRWELRLCDKDNIRGDIYLWKLQSDWNFSTSSIWVYTFVQFFPSENSFFVDVFPSRSRPSALPRLWSYSKFPYQDTWVHSWS